MGEIRCTLKQVQDGVAVPLDERTTIVVVPAVAQVTLTGRSFDSGRTFLLPRTQNALNEVFAFATRMQANHAVVVGHVEDVDPEPDALSEARATIAASWLAGDVEPWLSQYGDGIAESRRWGAREDKYLLSVVVGDGASAPAKEGESGDAQVRAFQASVGITVDGIAGPVTRRKLIEKYFARSRQAFLTGAVPPENGITLLETKTVPHPAGAHFTLQQVMEAKDADSGSATGELEPAANARIDFMFFFADAGPEPKPRAADGPEFLEWVKQTEMQRTAVVSATSGASVLSLELWDKQMRTRHKGAKYTLTGPETLSGVTNSQGRIEHDNVSPGDYTLSLTLEFFEAPDKITDEYRCSVVVHSASDTPQIRAVGAVPRCELARLKGLLFDTNKAFLAPEALAALKDVRQMYERHSGSELLVVGHTDTTGAPSVNDPLSWERAKATLAYLQDDVDAWLAFYEASMPPERRWGEAEDARMQELVQDPSLQRRYLIAAYMALDGAELDSAEFQIKGTAHGCGENFPLNDTREQLDEEPANNKADALDRRVELFFFDAEFGIVPQPQREISAKDSKQYLAWRSLAEQTLDIEIGNERLELNDIHLRLLSNSGAHALAGCDCVVQASQRQVSGRTNESGDLLIKGVEPGYHSLAVSVEGKSVQTLVPTVRTGSGPYLHRVAGATLGATE